MLKEFKGTKGEWKIDLEYKSIERVQIIDSNNNGFIDVWKLGKITKEEMKANAKLISKAPEMLESLQFFVNNNMLSVIGEEVAERLINEILE